jgi:pyruvate,water dikinase
VQWENAIWQNLATKHGMMFDGIEFREINGWVYQRLRPLGGKDRKPPPGWLMWLLVRTAPPIRARLKQLQKSLAEDLGMQSVERWNSQWKAEQVAEIEQLRSVNLDSLTDAQFDAHLARVLAFGDESLRRHFELTMPIATVAQLAFFCHETLGWDDGEVIKLLSGLSVASTEPARALSALAEMAAQRPAVRALLEAPDESTLQRLASADPEFLAAFEDYQHRFGCRALRYEVIDPTIEEVPGLTLGLIHDQLVRAFDPKREFEVLRERRDSALTKARQRLLGRPQADRDRFEYLMARAERYYPTREDNEFYTVSAPLALLRYGLLEMGRRLEAAGLIEARDDVFLLEVPASRKALQAGTDCREMVARGSGASLGARTPRATYGEDIAGPPPLSVFPADAALNISMVLWATEKIMAPEAEQPNGGSEGPAAALKGVPAAPGTYTGPARVIMDETEFDKIQPGDVLVCPITSPVWSIIFPSVGALVTDTGGILSHPAIISREYGIPAVVATRKGTSLLKDGEMVTVDGAAGTVTRAAS